MAAHSEEAIQQALALVREIENQTDRGAAIIGVAWVEEELHAAIQSVLEKDKTAWDRLFSKSGPLSSFSAKIDLARLLRMVSETVRGDLHIIRDIRNEFAHSVLAKDDSVLSFNSPHIKDKIFALRCVKHEKIDNPRVAFIRAGAVLNSDFYIHRLVSQNVDSGHMIRAAIEGEI